MKQPVLFFTTASKSHMPYAKALINSFKKFHPDIPFLLITDATEGLPTNILVEDLKPYLDDPHFWYRQKPIVMEKYLKDYDLVCGLDSDQLVLGNLDYLWETKDYDVGCVLNYNELDAKQYGLIGGAGILPIEYVNCGLVAARSEKFVHEWLVWCMSPQFERFQYREQDGLNIKVYHGNWNCRIFDHGDGPAKMHALWGLFGKTYWNRCELKDNKIILPKSDEEGKFPNVDTEIKVIHMGGGKDAKKDNWGIFFSQEVMKRINYLTSDAK